MIDGGTTKVYTHYCTVSAQAKRIRIIDRVCLAMRLDHPSRLSLTTCSHDPCSIHSHLTLYCCCAMAITTTFLRAGCSRATRSATRSSHGPSSASPSGWVRADLLLLLFAGLNEQRLVSSLVGESILQSRGKAADTAGGWCAQEWRGCCTGAAGTGRSERACNLRGPVCGAARLG